MVNNFPFVFSLLHLLSAPYMYGSVKKGIGILKQSSFGTNMDDNTRVFAPQH